MEGSADPFAVILTTMRQRLPADTGTVVATFNPAEMQRQGLSLRQMMHGLALENCLYHVAPSLPTATTLAEVQGLIEAIYHCRALQFWDMAQELMNWPIGAEQRPLYDQLGCWGCCRQQIELHQDLIGKLDAEVDLQSWNELGHAHRILGEFQTAQTYHEAQLHLAQTLSHAYEEMRAWGGLGHVFYDLCQFQQALVYLQQQLQQATACEAGPYQFDALVKLGRIYSIQFGRHRRGLPYLQQALTLAERLQDARLKTQALNHLAGTGCCGSASGSSGPALPSTDFLRC